MAKGLIEIAIQLGSKLGANTSKFLGTRSNVSFLGSGRPKDGMLFQKSINPESFATIGIEKVIPDIESSLAYAAGGKLNDIELSTLIKNLKTMDETLNPTNVVDMGGGIASLSENPARGFIKQGDEITSENFGTSQFAPGNNSEFLKNIDTDSLRAKSGIGERQLTEAASDVAKKDSDAMIKEGLDPSNPNDTIKAMESGILSSTADTSPLMSRLNNTVNDLRVAADNLPPPGSRGGPDDIAAPVMNYGDEGATGIMQTVDKVDLPGKRAASREFLFNALKKENPNQTTFADIVDPVDAKLILEGGGGVMGDPIVLVQKYFGPRIAEMLPVNASSEEMVIFTNRVLNNVVDAKGAKPTDSTFDSFTARFVEDLADGGIAGLETRQGLKFGGKIGKSILAKIDDTMIKKAADDIFPTDDYKYDAEMVVEALVENNPKLFKNLLADDLDDALRSELYGLAVSETGTRAAMKIKANRAGNVVDTTITEKVTPKGFSLNVERAVSELNIPRAEAIRISQLPSDQQKLELQKYLDRDMAQRIALADYNPKTFDAAKGGLAKILEL